MSPCGPTRRSIVWPVLLAVLVIVVASVVVYRRRQYMRVRIVNILNNPREYEGKRVMITGYYCGWRIPESVPGPPITAPPDTRSDWIIRDDTGWIYATARGEGPPLRPDEDFDVPIRVYGMVMVRRIQDVDIPYIYPERVEVLV